jgi:hypothetical protein
MQKDVDKLKVALKRLTETIRKATQDGAVSCSAIIIEVFKAVWPIIKLFLDLKKLQIH